MKLRQILLIALVASALSSSAAYADTFNFSFELSTILFSATDVFSGTGTLTGFAIPSGGYEITSVSGTITNKSGAVRQILSIDAPAELQDDAALLGVPGPDYKFDNLNDPGLNFELVGGAQVSVFTAIPPYTQATPPFDGELLKEPDGTVDFQDNPYTVTAATPEPGSFVLLASGLLGAVGAARRRLSR